MILNMENSETASEIAAKNVRELRKARDWSLKDLSSRLESVGRSLSVNTLSQLERSERGMSVDDFVALAQVFAVPLDRLTVPSPTIDPGDLADLVVDVLERDRKAKDALDVMFEARDAWHAALEHVNQSRRVLQVTLGEQLGVDLIDEQARETNRATVEDWAQGNLRRAAADTLLSAIGYTARGTDTTPATEGT